ncbi:MAG: phytanoyl-CoA dioxygenase family protein [Pseudomonadota bacterium]
MTDLYPSAIDDFDRDGVVLLRGLFGDWVEPLRAGVAANMAAPGADARIYPNADGGARFFGDYCNWQRIPEYKAFVFDSPAAEIAARLMGSKTARLFHEHVLVKEPGAETATPWHHDQPYYCVDGRQSCSLWLALDPVPRETCVEYVAGSHRWGKRFRPERFDRSALNEDDGLEPVPDIVANRGDYDIRGYTLEPGDAIAFSFLTLHGAPPNRSTRQARRAFSSRWVGDDARFARRQGTTSPPFREVDLNPGATLDHPAFPLIFPPSAS